MSDEPKRLLTDQRTPLQKMAAKIFEQFRETDFFSGGVIPRNLIVGPLSPIIPKDQVISRMMYERMRVPVAEHPPCQPISATVSMKQEYPSAAELRVILEDSLTPAMRRAQEQVAALARAYYEATVLKAVYGGYFKAPYGERIAALLRSQDRRQRKRGRRLLTRWHKGN